MQDFVHLHLHTQYSLLDGAADIVRTVKKAKQLNMKSLAITDHGVLYGVVDFYLEAHKNGIHPIIGCEVYTAPRTRFDKVNEADRHYGHLVLLCENNIGYQNLLKLVTKSNLEGFYYKPRVDWELLEQYHEGLIALSGCIRGFVPMALLGGSYETAKKTALRFQKIFGKENFYLEIQNHGMEEEQTALNGLVKLSTETEIPLVATNDVHYTTKDESLYQDVLSCIQTGKKLSDSQRMKMMGEEYYLKSQQEMSDLFQKYPSALENTVKIAARCNVTLDFNTMHLPQIQIDEPLSHPDYLKKLCCDGVLKKYGAFTSEIQTRLDYELSVIQKMGYTDYFLIVHDFIRYAKEKGIAVGPGRGSAAGSIAAYVLNITEIDPLEYNLLFERFLNPERVSMPDIDIDLCYERRDEVRDYVAEKYGADRVCQIITFGTMAARASVRDVGRALDTDPFLVDKIAKSIPNVLHIKLQRAIEETADLKKLYQTEQSAKQLLNIAMALEGFPRHASTHAAGVVISDAPLTEYVPLQTCDTGLLTQYPMAALEKLGLLKMDFLGLRNLTVIRDTIRLVQKNSGIALDINRIDLKDKKTFSMIQRGDTDAVFQLENPGLQTFLRNFKPAALEDIVTTTSIYRPGPMDQIPEFLKNVAHPEKISYKHPLLKPILEETYGVVIYQEQVMKIVRSLAGYSLGRADLVRRTMAKKKFKEMEQEREIFLHGLQGENGEILISGAIRNGIEEKTANEIFDALVDFANYAFNKSHAACYALVAYRTAYLKAHFPTQYLAAVLENYPGYSYKATKYIASFSKYGIRLLPPDVNRSYTHFQPEGKNIRFGLCWVKNVGMTFPENMAREREKNGPFVSFYDFIKRMSSVEINKRTVEVMIKTGCFDSLYANRRVLILNFETLLESALQRARDEKKGQLSWFEDSPDEDDSTALLYTDSTDFTAEEKMNFEYELTAMYFSGNPLDPYRLKLTAFSDSSLVQLLDADPPDGKRVKISGRISGVKVRKSKSGKTVASMRFADTTGFCEMTAFEAVFAKNRSILTEGSVICADAVISRREDQNQLSLVLKNAVPLQSMEISRNKKLYVKLENREKLDLLKDVAAQYPGENELYVFFEEDNSLLKADKNHRIHICDAFFSRLLTFLDAECIKIR